MEQADTEFAGRWLREVEVRPVRGVGERRRWDALVAQHHYLPFRGLFGKSLRHVAVRGERWLALLGWQAGAFKVGVRDAWIGWTREQQFSRLHLVANNARFAVLDEGRVANLASRALGLSLRRLSQDMRDAHGHPVLLAETFVDPQRFAGTCYRASNWVLLGRTRGFSRAPGGTARWREHGRAKEVYVYEMEKDAAAALRRAELPGDWRTGSGALPPPAPELRSLHAFLEDMADFRKARGRRYGLACYVTIMIAARLAGYRGVSAFAEFAGRMDQEQLAAVGAFFSPSRGRRTAPAASTFHYILSSLAPDMLDRALGAWTRQRSDGAAPVALDGKDVRGASKQTDGERHLVKQGKGCRETAYGLTSLGAEQAGPEEIAALVRHHWHIENRLHYVRDFTYDEDRCRAHVGNLPRNLACLTNAAISIVRYEGRFEYLPPANRHYAARPQEALDAVLAPPSG